MARTILLESSLSKDFWAKVVNTACYIQNHVFLRPILKKNPYELWKGRKSNISYFHVFGSECFILNTKDKLLKFDPKSDPGIFLGYSSISKAYRVYNKRTQIVEETIHISFKEKKKDDLGQNIHDLEEGMEDLSLKDKSINQSSLHIATRESNEEMANNHEPFMPHHVSDHIPEDSKASPMKRRYTSARDLRAISRNQVIDELSQGVRTNQIFI